MHVLWKSVWQLPQKVHIESLHSPANPFQVYAQNVYTLVIIGVGQLINSRHWHSIHGMLLNY
jgi:hypothetical protein